jgi:acetyltransferase/esterase
VDDAAELLKKYSPNEPATVIGNSSGAIISLRLLITHPDLVKTVIPYEPPAAKLLPAADLEYHRVKHQEAYDLYRKKGVHAALEVFAELVHARKWNPAKAIDFSKPYMFSNTM